MIRLTKLWVAFIMLLIAGHGSPGQAAESGARGTATQKASLTYEVHNVVTVTGIITSLTPEKAASSLPEPIVLTMQSDQGKIQVFLGPNWFVEKQEMRFAPLDKVEVTGSRIMDKGRPIILAAEIKKGEETLKLRDAQGMPLWGGQKRPPGQ